MESLSEANATNQVSGNPHHKLISGVVDRYKGIEIKDLSQFIESESGFDEQLTYNLEKWKSEGIRSIQIHFAPPYCQLMNVAAKHGFYFHHASPKGYVLMCLWLDTTIANRIPPYPDHYVGVAGLVVNDLDQILLIQEVRSAGPRMWKLPGGFVDPGETIKQASEREVLEESGLKCEFQGILGARELLNFRYGATDLYVVCLLKLKGEEQQQINIIDKHEIFDAKWVPIQELSSNNEDSIYKFSRDTFQFISGVYKEYQQHMKNLFNRVEYSNRCGDFTFNDYLNMTTLTYEEALPNFTPQQIKEFKISKEIAEKPWFYYLPARSKTGVQWGYK